MLTKVIALSCLFANALTAPQAATVLPSDVLRAIPAIDHPVITSTDCKIEYETIESQTCVMRAAEQCDEIEVVHEKVAIGKKCKEVTSRHCSAVRFVKRDADADADADAGAEAKPFYSPYTFGGLYAPSAYAAIPATNYAFGTPAIATTYHHEPSCHDVTTEHCIDHPEVVKSPEPLKRCHIVQRADCTPVEKKIPKTICEPKSVDLRSPPVPGAVPTVVHPFAYTGYNGYF